jgi:hypothetical protein
VYIGNQMDAITPIKAMVDINMGEASSFMFSFPENKRVIKKLPLNILSQIFVWF